MKNIFLVLLSSLISLLLININLDCISPEKNQKKFDSFNFSRLRDGDLIFKMCLYLDSEIVNLVDKNGNYSHVGIIVKRGGMIFVLSSEPNAGVEFQNINDFLKDASSFSIFRLNVNENLTEKAVKAGKTFLNRPFDNNFDLTNNNKIYCTELVWKSFLKAGFDLTCGKFNHFNFIFFKKKNYILPSLLLSSKKIKKIY